VYIADVFADGVAVIVAV